MPRKLVVNYRAQYGGTMDINIPEGRLVHRGRKVALHVVSVERAGEVVEREMVVHPGAVVLVPILPDGRLVLIRNHRFALGTDVVELPAGTLEPPEDAEDRARQELVEETGYEAELIEPLGRFFAAPGYCTEELFAFLATGLQWVGQRLEKGEEITPYPIPLGEVPERIRSGEIRDSKSLAALALYFARLGTLKGP